MFSRWEDLAKSLKNLRLWGTMNFDRAKKNLGGSTVLAFRVRGSENGFKVLDVMVEGISMLVTQRSDFASVIRREGIDGFLDRMQEVAQRNSP